MFFTSIISKRLKDLFDAKFKEYTDNISWINKIKSETITQNLVGNVQSYFNALRDIVKEVWAQVFQKLVNSKSVSELEALLFNMKDYFDKAKPDYFIIQKA